MASSRFIAVSVTPTIGTDAYTANDVVGGLLTFDVTGGAIGGGLINSAWVVDDDDEKAALKLYLFDEAPTTIADDAAFEPTAADLKKLVSVVSISAYTTVNSNAYCVVEDINNVFTAPNGNLYGYLVCTATPTYTAATDLTVKLMILAEQR